MIAALVLSLAAPVQAYQAAQDAEDWVMFGRMLSLVQMFVRLAAQSPDPQVMQKGVEAILSGENAQANRAATEMLDEMLREMPPEHRDTVLSIGRDLLVVARRDQARRAAREDPELGPVSAEQALQARRDLQAMGLSYYDPKQFLDAVKRDDALAVELYVRARGVNLSARDAEGRTALDLARRAQNPRILALLAGAGAK
jgi:hypothetical protein